MKHGGLHRAISGDNGLTLFGGDLTQGCEDLYLLVRVFILLFSFWFLCFCFGVDENFT